MFHSLEGYTMFYAMSVMILMIVLGATPAFGLLSDVEYYCGNKPADIIFLLDVSNSIWGPDFQKQLEFVNNVVDIFEIADNITRIGVGTFSNHFHREFALGRYFDKVQVKKAINRISQRQGYATNTGSALWHMRSKMFTESDGARSGVAKVAIILTDGQSSNMAKTVYEAFRAKMENIQIFGIGIGSNINSRELRMMSSSPSDEFSFEVENYAALDAIKQTLAVRTCKVTAPPTTSTTTTTTTTPSTTTSLLDAAREMCRGKTLDIVFALDSSDNIIDEDLEKQAIFFRTLVDQFDVLSNRVRFASFMYSDQIQKMFDFNEYENSETIKDALMKLGTTAGSSRVSHALSHLLTKSFRRSITRPNAAQVGIIVTGSPSKHLEHSKKVVMKAKRSGLQFIAIGVGEKVDSEELRVISASSDDSHYFKLDSFHQLMKILPELVHQVCQVPEPEIPMSDQTCGDRQSADMMFLLDSVNAGKKNTRKALTFLKALVDKLAIDKERIQVGLMSPECQEEMTGFKLNEFTNKESALSAFGEVKGTDFHSILHQMRRRAFSPQEGGRKDAKKIAILIVDGELDEPLETLLEAQRARTHGVEVYVVQVGKGQTQVELLMMCDEPTQQHFFKVENYDVLMELVDKLVQALCDEL